MARKPKTNTNINGKKYFRIRLTIGQDHEGKDIIKNFYGTSKTNAMNKRDEWKKNDAKGINQIEAEGSLTRAMFTWVWDVLSVAGKKDSTFERYEGIYRNYVKDSDVGIMKLKNIKKHHIQKHYTKLSKEENKSHSQIKNLHKLLNMFFRYAVEEGYSKKNPCAKIDLSVYEEDIDVTEVDLFIEEEGSYETFSEKEIEILQKDIKNEKLRIMTRFALGTGLRQGEILALKKTDIRDMKVQVVKSIKSVKIFNGPGDYKYELKEIEPKTKYSSRIVPIPSSLEGDLIELNKIRNKEKLKLGELYKDNNLLFPSSTGTYMDARNLQRSWERSFKDTGIEYKKFHALRHTFATQLIKNGSQLITVSRLLGHSSVKITEVYAHVIGSTKFNDVELLNSLFE